MSKQVDRVEPRTLSGFMELLPRDQIKFNKIMDTIRRVYEQFGFLPIDTPLLELSEVLLAKAGGETEKQIYQFKKGDNDLVLRFDLTVSFAKYVAKNYYNLKFPFRKYLIGKVYRGERPQKGRFREFYQADIDIIGDGELSIINDAEIPSIIYKVFKEIGIGNFIIKVNNRKLLSGFLNSLDLDEKVTDVLRLIDKIHKIGTDEVKKELEEMNINVDNINSIMNFISINGNSEQIIKCLEKMNIDNELFSVGLDELKQVTKYIKDFGVDENYFAIDLTITRGLDYYTGTVYETFIIGHEDFGSICSGGRYDNLAEYYTDKELPGVGISIGITRLFSLLEENNLLPEINNAPVDVLIIPLMDDLSYPIKISTYLKDNGIANQLYYEQKNLKNKINYASQLGIPYIMLIGEDEEKNEMVTIKNIDTREQKLISIEEAIKILKSV